MFKISRLINAFKQCLFQTMIQPSTYVQITALLMILLTTQMTIVPHPRTTTITLLVTYQVLESHSAIATLVIVAVAVKWIGVTITA